MTSNCHGTSTGVSVCKQSEDVWTEVTGACHTTPGMWRCTSVARNRRSPGASCFGRFAYIVIFQIPAKPEDYGRLATLKHILPDRRLAFHAKRTIRIYHSRENARTLRPVSSPGASSSSAKHRKNSTIMEEGASSQEDAPNRETSASYVARFRRSCRNRRSHDEVADLAAELQRAYTVKELQAQLEEKRGRRQAELVRERECAELTRQQQREALEEELRRRSDILRRSEEYRRQLDQQLTRKDEERRVLAEEAREYRKTLEEMDRAQEECERSRALEKKCELAEKTRRERLVLEEMKEERRQEEREAEERKRRQDLEYLQEMDERSEEVKRLRREQIEWRESVLLEAARMILDAEARKREKEERLFDLVTEEIRRELVIREREQGARRRRMQQELAAGLEEQIVLTEQCKQRFVEEDRAWAEDVMRKIMEDERLARCTAEARRRMKVQHREDLENLIAYRRRIREQEIARMEESIKEEQRLALLEAECAKEQRRRLLAAHAADIASFVNRAALTADERRILDELTEENRNNVDDSAGDRDVKTTDDDDMRRT
ncbi:trichohyalin-like isoform X2 [Odontomachus brunneus]|uniref:trichohyalin-like isoform X2 n=1 Tax=Odontomachus brunneus TaxID=486640 RepID=UPI0013F29A88|nr:trichohyalin-like isoform X2 [Odontomachus brunneus]